MRFRTTLKLHGKTATGIEVPADVVEALGSKRPAVRATINGYTYRSTVAARGDVFLLGVSAEVREAAGVAAGDELDVELALDTEPRELAVPADFAALLDRDPAIRERFDDLSFSRRRAFVDPINAARTDETRERRIAKALAELRTG
jgi:Domain of unknown function (DUF1905)/Bacteriocin-protection, YdeI or OmpD-Associated